MVNDPRVIANFNACLERKQNLGLIPDFGITLDQHLYEKEGRNARRGALRDGPKVVREPGREEGRRLISFTHS
jgi:hypothetical protein